MTDPIDNQLTDQPHVRLRIMNAAGQLFADRGFDATSISDITEAAGVGRALIYYYFKDKRALHDSILRDGGQCIIDAAQTAYAHEDTALGRIRRFMTLFRQLHANRPNIGRIAMRAELEGNLSPDIDIRKPFDEVTSLLKTIVEEGIAKGEIRSMDADKAVHIIMGIVHSLVMMHIRRESDMETDRDTDGDIDLAMDIMATGVAAS